MNFRRQFIQAIVSFLVNLWLGFLGIRYIIRLRYPDKPSRTVANENVGDGKQAILEFLIAMSFWGLVSLIVAIAIGRFYFRWLLNRFRKINYN